MACMAFQRPIPTVGSVLLLALLAGCGNQIQTYPVSGTVTLPDGRPLAGATVSMEAVDHSVSATAQTDAQGRFALSTLESGDGVPRGKYRALVLPPMSADPDQAAPMPFDPKYTRYETSGLEFEITGATDSLTIQLQ